MNWLIQNLPTVLAYWAAAGALLSLINVPLAKAYPKIGNVIAFLVHLSPAAIANAVQELTALYSALSGNVPPLPPTGAISIAPAFVAPPVPTRALPQAQTRNGSWPMRALAITALVGAAMAGCASFWPDVKAVAPVAGQVIVTVYNDLQAGDTDQQIIADVAKEVGCAVGGDAGCAVGVDVGEIVSEAITILEATGEIKGLSPVAHAHAMAFRVQHPASVAAPVAK
jgi:hypothetical protein